MNDTPHDGTWIVIDCENGRELIVRWQAVGVDSLFLGKGHLWITDSEGPVKFLLIV